MRRTVRAIWIATAAFAVGSAAAVAARLEVVSVALDPSREPAAGSSAAALSEDSRLVFFQSPASNLVEGDTNRSYDIFLFDRSTHETARLSLDSAGAQANAGSYTPAVSADGRIVAFDSDASNLVAGDGNGRADIFVHDRLLGATTRISRATDGTESNGASGAPAVSADGRFVAFQSLASNLVAEDTNGRRDIFVHDRLTGATSLVSRDPSGGPANAASYSPGLSADGRLVAFESTASNLVADDTNGVSDVFVHDRLTGTTTRVSRASAGTPGNDGSYLPAISADGRFVAFVSGASNLVDADTNGVTDVFLHDRSTGVTTRASRATEGPEANAPSSWPALSADGELVAFSSAASNLVDGDTNGVEDVFVHDRLTGATRRVSRTVSGLEARGDSDGPALSPDGRIVAFESLASNLTPGDSNGDRDVFVHDRLSGAIERTPDLGLAAPPGTPLLADGPSGESSLSADGRFVAFSSAATNLVAGDTNDTTDVFVRDRLTTTTVRISLDSAGLQGNGTSASPSLSADGRYVAFVSTATNLVAGDTNGAGDAFVHDRQTATTTRVSLDSAGLQADGASSSPSLSADGRYVAFVSTATNLVAGDTNHAADVFVHDRLTGATTRGSIDIAGLEGDASSDSPALSADGRFVAFHSSASNLVADDTNLLVDVFVRDRLSGATTRASLATTGTESDDNSFRPALSGDGRFVAFQSAASNLVAADTNSSFDVFVHDRVSGTTMRASVDSDGAECNGASYEPALSADGRFVAFESWASNLVAGDSNGLDDVFVYDRTTGETRRISEDSLAGQGNDASYRASVSPDGRVVSFLSAATNFVAGGDTNEFVDLFVRATESCVSDAKTACLQGGRFEVRVSWDTSSARGDAQVMAFDGARTENLDSAFFTFFGPTNFEMGLKVLDACVPAFGNKYWVFISGLTDQGWQVRVRDLATGRSQTYTNALGTLSRTFRDAATFDCTTTATGTSPTPPIDLSALATEGGAAPGPAEPRIAARFLPTDPSTPRPESLPARQLEERDGTCLRTATTACLQGGRFEVRVAWQTSSGVGTAEVMRFAGHRTENSDSVFYTFFSPTNFEMGLKVLDACVPAFDNKYWVFVSGLTDQGWTATVRDTVTGRTRSYQNPLGSLSETFVDAASFGCS